jgi:dihydrofolate reductase
MRKLVYAINLTLDGCCDHTKGIGNEDMHIYHANLLRQSDTFLYGRTTYELMVPFWPDMAKNQSGDTKSMNDFATAFVSVKKIVVASRTLQNVDSKTKIIRTNLKEEVLKLKQEEGKSILTGGVDIPSQLIQAGLVDECYFVYQPRIVGEGRRLFDNLRLQDALQMKLVDTKILSSGIAGLHYVKE